MDWTTTLLRFVHVLFAVVWVGGAAYTVHFLQPGLRTLAPEVQRPAALAVETRAAIGMLFSAGIVFVTGAWLVARTLGLDGLENLFKTDWGRSIVLGSLLAVAMFIVGVTMVIRSVFRIKAMADQGIVPSPEEGARLQLRMRRGSVAAFALGTLALLEMVIARGFH